MDTHIVRASVPWTNSGTLGLPGREWARGAPAPTCRLGGRATIGAGRHASGRRVLRTRPALPTETGRRSGPQPPAEVRRCSATATRDSVMLTVR